MSAEFDRYRADARKFFGADHSTELPRSEFQRLFDWYAGGGREQFEAAFSRETGLSLWLSHNEDGIVEAAIPKSYRDAEKKFAGDAFYRAHATWFVKEMDRIIDAVPREACHPSMESAYGDVMAFARKVVIDSVVLFEHWGHFRMGVPGVYGIHKNPFEHIMAFYQGSKQIIYGPGSWKLSYSDNHSDLAIATIRQAVELRLRRGFGIMGKMRTVDDTIHPIPLSEILDAVDSQKNNITFPVKFDNISRINGWCNMYMHTGIKPYTWCPPRILKFLENFLLGGTAPGYYHTDKAGIVVSRQAFDAVRDLIRQKHEENGFTLPLMASHDCLVVIT